TAEVPCAGTKLLGDAREAQALMPDARAQVARCAREREQVQLELADARGRCEALAGAPQALAWAEHRETVARERAGRLAVLTSKARSEERRVGKECGACMVSVLLRRTIR